MRPAEAQVLSEAVTPGWYDDPNGRFEYRYHNGERWTADVAARGQRLLDPLGTAPTPARAAVPRALPPHVAAVVPPGWSASVRPRSPARLQSVLALVFGLVAAALAIVPFLFVIGAASAVAALILGVLALRRSADAPAAERAGRGRAIAGIVLAPVALALCVVGFVFTRATMREFDEYLEPGIYTVEVDSCGVEDGLALAAGTIENGSEVRRTYLVVLEYRDPDRDDVLARARVEVEDVPAGSTREWRDATRLRTGAVRSDLAPTCSVEEVTGPFPFGIEQR